MRQSKAFTDFRGSEVVLDVAERFSLTSHFTTKNCNIKGFEDIFIGDIKKEKNGSKTCY